MARKGAAAQASHDDQDLDLDVDLEKFDDAYDDAEATEAASALPDGDYIVMVDQAVVKKAASGNVMLALELKTVKQLTGLQQGDDPEHVKDRKQFKNIVFTEKNMGIVKGELQKLGLVKGETEGFDKFSDLKKDEVLELILDKELWVTRKTKGEDKEGRPNVNIYINGTPDDYDAKAAEKKAGKGASSSKAASSGKPAAGKGKAAKEAENLSFDE
jgi:hypothetical protein